MASNSLLSKASLAPGPMDAAHIRPHVPVPPWPLEKPALPLAMSLEPCAAMAKPWHDHIWPQCNHIYIYGHMGKEYELTDNQIITSCASNMSY